MAVSLATGGWEELQPHEGQMVLVERLQRERGALQHGEGDQQNTGGRTGGSFDSPPPCHFVGNCKRSASFWVVASEIVV